MAMACFRFFTGRRPPDFSFPSLNSSITLAIFFEAFFPYLRPELLREELGDEDERRELLLREEPLLLLVDPRRVLRWLAERFALALLRPVLLRPELLRERELDPLDFDDVERELDLRLVVAIF
jgi:hypothetical protein